MLQTWCKICVKNINQLYQIAAEKFEIWADKASQVLDVISTSQTVLKTPLKLFLYEMVKIATGFIIF